MLAEGQLRPIDDFHHRDAAREAQRGLKRVGESADPAPTGDQAVHHHLDRVGVVAIQPDPLAQVHDLAVHAGPAESLARQVTE